MNYHIKFITNAFKIMPFHRAQVMYLLSIFLLTNLLNAQTRVSASADTTQIKIGEQINFTVKVETDTTAQVIFPEGPTFSPLEVVEESPIDTIRNNDKYNLIKNYALTRFDSGACTLPRQQILIDKKPYFTDSLNIIVATVAVDTTKQKMFDIKPLTEVEKSGKAWGKYLWYILIFLAIAGGLLYWFVFRKKTLTEAEKEALLPPYDRALLALKKLDESRYLIQSEYKAYYTRLTGIVRAYLEEEVNIAALESTTNELMAKLELLKEAETLNLDETTIQQFNHVLQTADLVKFARSRPETKVAEQDRKTMEEIVSRIKEALPEPTEEELMQNEAYLAEMARKKKKKRSIRLAVAAAAVVLLVAAGTVWYYGFNEIKDRLLGHPTKSLLESEWVASEYGYPPVYIETPEVLKRTEKSLPEAAQTRQAFSYGSLPDNFYILLNAIPYKEGSETDMKKAIDTSISALEAKGAEDIIVKQEDFVTPTGKEGVKVHGSMTLTPEGKKPEKRAYVMLNFAQNGSFQQIIMVYKEEDGYAEQIVNRIINSIDFKAGT